MKISFKDLLFLSGGSFSIDKMMQLNRSLSRFAIQQKRNFKVAVLGASGGIGQPLALLMKLDPKVTELSLFDVVRTPGKF